VWNRHEVGRAPGWSRSWVTAVKPAGRGFSGRLGKCAFVITSSYQSQRDSLIQIAMLTAGMMIASPEWSPLIPWKWISPPYRRAFLENVGLQCHLLVRYQLQAFDQAWLPTACFPNETSSDAPLTSSKTTATGEERQCTRLLTWYFVP
jgi:hypothetical protein